MIKTKLMEHQQKIIDFCLEKPFAGIFAEYGTGKTLCALALAQILKMNRVLIVSTKTSCQSTWPDEIRMHTDFRGVVLIGSRKQKLHALHYGLQLSRGASHQYSMTKPNIVFFLVNYDGVRNIYNELMTIKWDAVFLDESTKIKSPKTLRTRIAWSLNSHIRRRYIMTGFPVTEDLSDLYAQIKFLDKGFSLGNNFSAFLNEYFVRGAGQKIFPKARSVKTILSKISEFCIRVSNESLKLPPRIYKRMVIEQTPQQIELLRQLKETFRLELGKVQIDTQYIFALITKSLEICDGFVQDNEGRLAVIDTEKDEALLETLEEIDVRYNKVVIWCAFLFSVKKLKRVLERLGHKVLVLTGETEDVNITVRKFQYTKDHNILIATQKKAAESITLTACRFAIYYSNVWSNDLRSNSEARIRRKGSEKHKSIMYIDFVTKGSVELNVYNCLRRKKDLINDMKNSFAELQGDGNGAD